MDNSRLFRRRQTQHLHIGHAWNVNVVQGLENVLATQFLQPLTGELSTAMPFQSGNLGHGVPGFGQLLLDALDASVDFLDAMLNQLDLLGGWSVLMELEQVSPIPISGFLPEGNIGANPVSIIRLLYGCELTTTVPMISRVAMNQGFDLDALKLGQSQSQLV